MTQFEVFQPDFDTTDYFVVTYKLSSTKSLENAAWNLAIGQSVGNPNVRNAWESDELFAKHSCIVLEQRGSKKLQRKSGTVKIAFPLSNIDFLSDGMSQFLCHIMGGQLDIDSIVKCHVLDVQFPDSVKNTFLGPKFGIQGIRKYTGVYDKPLLGGIVKPKVCMNEDILLDLVKALVDGGVNFIKEDEIMANPSCCTLEKRLPKLAQYLSTQNVVYCVCINADPHNVLDRVKQVHEAGVNGVHVNFWSGLGVYNSIRKLDLPLFLHFQKSGDKIFTSKKHAFHIDWSVVCKLAGMMGADFIHNGMLGGYSSDDESELKKTVEILQSHGTMPALSCGMHPGLVEYIRGKLGNELLLNCGGAIHGHPGGTVNGARAMRQAIDRQHGKEYDEAISTWGLVQ
jgi:ribulose-bisphosphate carboxylase large chain